MLIVSQEMLSFLIISRGHKHFIAGGISFTKNNWLVKLKWVQCIHIIVLKNIHALLIIPVGGWLITVIRNDHLLNVFYFVRGSFMQFVYKHIWRRWLSSTDSNSCYNTFYMYIYYMLVICWYIFRMSIALFNKYYI